MLICARSVVVCAAPAPSRTSRRKSRWAETLFPVCLKIWHTSRMERRTHTGNARLIALLGPALVAGVAYLDPGNVAVNMSAGAQFGYLLVWVVVLANAMAWLIQYLSAKLGVVTGRSLAQTLGRRIREPVGAPRVLGAGGAHGDGDRYRRDHRGRGRTVAALRHSAAGRRTHHGRRVDGAARREVAPRSAPVRRA